MVHKFYSICYPKKKPTTPGKTLEECVTSPAEKISPYKPGLPPESEEGNQYLLVIIDYFTKLAESSLLVDMLAHSLTDVLYEQWILCFGVPC